MPAEFLGNLPKNLTTHLTHKLYAVFPLYSFSRVVQTSPESFCTGQRIDDVYQEPQQYDCIIGIDLAAAVTVCILLGIALQNYGSGNRLIQKHRIGDVHSAVQIGITIEDCS